MNTLIKMKNKSTKIKAYWNKRAIIYKESANATLSETPLRRIEIKKMIGLLKKYKPSQTLEIGCGNGYSTSIYASKFSRMKIFATDFSENMLKIANKKYKKRNIRYSFWDISQPKKFPYKIKSFDLIFSQRVIQNLPSWNIQKIVIKNLLGMLNEKGVLILMECAKDGVKQVNNFRRVLGQDKLKGIIPWHNKFLEDKKMKKKFENNLIEISHFASTYMFLTRIISFKMSEIVQLFPSIGKFGYSRVYILKNK